jgi:fructose-bisphosphate aldolase class I
MKQELSDIANALVAPGKGILAADESGGTIKKRFDSIGVGSTEETRRDYREMLFRAGEGMKNYVSGVILYDETIRQKAKDGTPLVDIMRAAGAVPGIKVDAGAKTLAGPHADIETVTEGLDGLCEALPISPPRRPLRQVARGDHHRRQPDEELHQPTRMRSRYAALCREAASCRSSSRKC